MIRKQIRLIADMQKVLVVCIEGQTCHNVLFCFFLSQNLVQSRALALIKSVKAEKDEEAAEGKFEGSRS